MLLRLGREVDMPRADLHEAAASAGGQGLDSPEAAARDGAPMQ
jgi:hypothetical protein